MAKEIQLTQGKVAIVDDEDFEAISKYIWRYVKSSKEKTGYALTAVNRKLVRMHRLVKGLANKDKRQVDHINSNGLDNRRSNLRVCTMSENLVNRPKNKNNTSGYKGVYWYPKNKKWAVIITPKGKQIFVGFFKDKDIAALAYNGAALKYYGEFARLNEIPQPAA